VLGKAAKTIVAALDVPSTAQEGYSGSTTSPGSSSTSTHHHHHQRSPPDQRPAGTGPFAGGLQSGGICDDFYLINLLNFNSDYFYFNSNYF
jgi:hypothetical protein